MCGNYCLVTTAYVFLLLAVLSCAVSYVAPFWVQFSTLAGNSVLGIASHYKTSQIDIKNFWVAGLWGACVGGYGEAECGWFWQNEFYAEKLLLGECW